MSTNYNFYILVKGSKASNWAGLIADSTDGVS